MIQAINTQHHEQQLAEASNTTDTASATVPASQPQVIHWLIVRGVLNILLVAYLI